MLPIRLFLIAFLLGASAACHPQGAPPGPVVLAAASTQEAIEELADRWEHDGHARPVLSFAGTAALARQIEAGSPADIFLSADEEWMNRLEAEDYLRAETRVALLGNRLVLVGGPLWHGGDWKPPAQLASFAGSARIAVADTRAVPAGRYARVALKRMGQWEALLPRLVPAESVRAALALVERGQAELGIVYATDLIASDKVRLVGTFDTGVTPPILYPAAVLQSSTHRDAAGFLDYLRSDQARQVFRERGFEVLP